MGKDINLTDFLKRKSNVIKNSQKTAGILKVAS